jgi:Protein of unknown function (DUF3108)
MRPDCMLLRVAVATAVLVAVAEATAQSGIAEYRATYEVRHKGRRAADTEFSVAAAGNGEYLYASTTQARGLLKLLAPGPATEHSRLRVADGALQALQFEYVDGSRGGDDNFSIAFDRASGEVRITRADGLQTLALERDLLDRGSLQVALLRDLASCRMPGPYRWVDDDGIRTYSYERVEDATAETAAGDFPTVRFVQQREGSSRQSILWLAPSLSFVPVYVEQIEDGETVTVYTLESIAVSAPQTAECSGFR